MPKLISTCLFTLLFCSVLFLALHSQPAFAQSFPASDMITAKYQADQCLSVNGLVTATLPLVMSDCRGTNNQIWQRDSEASQWRTALDPSYCLATTDSSVYASGGLTVRPCVDVRALTLVANTTLSDSYTISGTSYVIDWGVYGFVAVAGQNGWTYQHWGWTQPALDIVNSQGCDIVYPFAATDSATYAREVACDQVARIQPPYVRPVAAKRNPAIFPGTVPSDTLTVTRTYAFDLNWKDQSYLRISAPTYNWKSTGLWALPDQPVRVTVSSATKDDMADVWLIIGEHTDILALESSNVQGDSFFRYPSVSSKMRLSVGENWVRNPYGGSIVLASYTNVDKIISVEISGAVQMPYLNVGQTSEAEWLAVRSSPVPYAELESELAVIHVPSSEIRELSFADAVNTANYYSLVGQMHNELSGLSATDVMTHQPALGKYRHVEDLQIADGWGHSGFPIMYYNEWHIGVPKEFVYKSAGWGVWHELGHNYQQDIWAIVYDVEVTVNIWSLFAQERLFGNSNLVDENSYASAIAILNDPLVTNKWEKANKLVFLDQIRLGFPELNWDLWTQLVRRYRDMPASEYDLITTDQLMRDKFLEVLCDITQTNLTPHFEAWTIDISQAPKDHCASKAPLTQAIWLIDGAKPLYHSGTGNGQIMRETWSNLSSGTAIVSLKSSSAYPSAPDTTSIISGLLESPTTLDSNQGERLRGYLHPPVSGEYRFWLAGGDSAQFLLSSDEEPIHATSLITADASSGYRAFDTYTVDVQRSISVTLQAGRKYYFEVVHQATTNTSRASVAWTIPASADSPFEPRKVIDGRYLSAYTGEIALKDQLVTEHVSPASPGSDVANVETAAATPMPTCTNNGDGCCCVLCNRGGLAWNWDFRFSTYQVRFSLCFFK